MKKKQDEAEKQRVAANSGAPGLGSLRMYDQSLFQASPLLQQWTHGVQPLGVPPNPGLGSTTGAHPTSQMMQLTQLQPSEKIPSIGSFSTFATFFDEGESSDTTSETQGRFTGSTFVGI